MTWLPGALVGRYRIEARIASGGMSEVFRSRHARSGDRVAVKMLRPALAASPLLCRRFDREGAITARLDHPRLCRLVDRGSWDGLPYLVLEYLPGERLDERLRAGPLPVAEAGEIAQQTAQGLEAAHAAGVIHRDVKPANVMLDPGGNATLFDFGLATLLAPGSEAESEDEATLAIPAGAIRVVLGTPEFMSPEQARGERTDARTDVWGLGALLYTMLTGVPPFRGASVRSVLDAVGHDEPDWRAFPFPTSPPEVSVCRRALAREPAARWPDAAAFRAALEEAAGLSGRC